MRETRQRRARTIPAPAADTPAASPTPAAPDAPASPPAEDAVTRFALPLDKDNRVLVSMMRESSRDKLRAVLAMPENRQALGVQPIASNGVDTTAIPPVVVASLCDAVSLLAVNLGRLAGYSADDASVLAFTMDDKRAIIPVAIPVLQKYSGALGRYQEEIILGSVLVSVMGGKIMLLRAKSASVIPFPSVAPQPESTDTPQ